MRKLTATTLAISLGLAGGALAQDIKIGGRRAPHGR